MSPLTLQRQQSLTPCITDREPLPDSSSDKEPGSPRVAGAPPPLSRVIERGGSFRDRQPGQRPLKNRKNIKITAEELKSAISSTNK